MKRVLLTSFCFLLMAVTGRAGLYGFTDITTNSSDRADIADQLFMDTTDINAGTSTVQFLNIGSIDSTVARIYFGAQDESLSLNIDSVISCSPGVFFDIGEASPGNPPGWNDFGNWWFITIGSIDAEPPLAHNGIDPGECLELGISIAGTPLSFSDAIELDVFRVALHVINEPLGESDSYVNNSFVVPEPASLLLIGSAGLFIGFVRRRVAG